MFKLINNPYVIIMTNRSATPVLFGFDFQANAAIVLMLENIKYMTSIRLEGYEDIEINLNDGSSVFWLKQRLSLIAAQIFQMLYQT